MSGETGYHGSAVIKEIATKAKARAFKKALACPDQDPAGLSIWQ